MRGVSWLGITCALVLAGAAGGDAQEEPQRPDVPHAFVLEMPLFGGLKMTTEARSERSCRLALAATRKKLLQEAAGIVKYELGECKLAR